MCVFIIVELAVVCTVLAQVFNPGFEDDIALPTGWSSRGDVVVRAIDPNDQFGAHYAVLGEPGAAAVSQIWQSIILLDDGDPNDPNDALSFRYRFDFGGQTERPVLVSAVSRMTHGGFGEVDIDVVRDTECRFGDPVGATTDLLIRATFGNRVALLGLTNESGGVEYPADILVDDPAAIVGQPTVEFKTVVIPIANVSNASELTITFPGVVDAVFQDPHKASRSEVCVVVLGGDFNNDGQVTTEDQQNTGHPLSSPPPESSWEESAVGGRLPVARNT